MFPVKSQSETNNFECKFEKSLGIKIDNKLNCKSMESWCKTASQKINALSKIAALMNFEQRRLIINLSLFILPSFVDVSQPKTKCPH